MEQKAIIIGATGLVGSQLVRQLLCDGRFQSVIVFTRRKTGWSHPKLSEQIVNFNQIDQWSDQIKGDVLFSAMGTTLKKAGSKEAQYKIDYTYQYQVAEAAATNGVSSYVLVSSAGASADSKIFYSRMKGELDEAVKKFNFRKTVILRPSILDGERKGKRPAEQASLKISRWVTRFIFKKYRPIKGETVAQAMIQTAASNEMGNGYFIYELDEIEQLTVT